MAAESGTAVRVLLAAVFMGAAALSDVAVQPVPAPAAVEGAGTDPAHVGAALTAAMMARKRQIVLQDIALICVPVLSVDSKGRNDEIVTLGSCLL